MTTGTKGEITDCYMTDKGLDWFYTFLRSKSLPFLRRTFPSVFNHYVDGTPFEEYIGLNNFRGVRGVNKRAGTVQRAMVTRRVKRCIRTYHFANIAQAREQLRIWLRYYPEDEFTLYRVRTLHNVDVKEEIPLVVSPGKRGHHLGKRGEY